METVSGLADLRAKVERHLPNFGAVESRVLGVGLPRLVSLCGWGVLAARWQSGAAAWLVLRASTSLEAYRRAAAPRSEAAESAGEGPRVNGNEPGMAPLPALRASAQLPSAVERWHPSSVPVSVSPAAGLPQPSPPSVKVADRGKGQGLPLPREATGSQRAGAGPALLSAPATSDRRRPLGSPPVAARPSAPSCTCRLRICASWRRPFLLVPLSPYGTMPSPVPPGSNCPLGYEALPLTGLDGLSPGPWGWGSPGTALAGAWTWCPFLWVHNLGSRLPSCPCAPRDGPLAGRWLLGWAWERLLSSPCAPFWVCGWAFGTQPNVMPCEGRWEPNDLTGA